MGFSVDKLTGSALFTDLTAAEIEKILSLAREVNWEEGDTICSEGDTGESIFIIYSGSVRISKKLTLYHSGQDEDSGDKVLRNVDATRPIVLGEMAMLTNQQRTASVTATRKCEGLEINGCQLTGLCKAQPDLGYNIMHNLACILSEHLKAANHDVTRLATALTVALG